VTQISSTGPGKTVPQILKRIENSYITLNPDIKAGII